MCSPILQARRRGNRQSCKPDMQTCQACSYLVYLRTRPSMTSNGDHVQLVPWSLSFTPGVRLSGSPQSTQSVSPQSRTSTLASILANGFYDPTAIPTFAHSASCLR